MGQLISEVSRDLSTLMRQEVELAKAEVRQEVVKTGKAAGLLGGAGFAGYMVLLFLSIAAWWGLANVMDQGWAALIVAGIWAVTGAASSQSTTGYVTASPTSPTTPPSASTSSTTSSINNSSGSSSKKST